MTEIILKPTAEKCQYDPVADTITLSLSDINSEGYWMHISFEESLVFSLVHELTHAFIENELSMVFLRRFYKSRQDIQTRMWEARTNLKKLRNVVTDYHKQIDEQIADRFSGREEYIPALVSKQIYQQSVKCGWVF